MVNNGCELCQDNAYAVLPMSVFKRSRALARIGKIMYT